jgi:hypothetical protein
MELWEKIAETYPELSAEDFGYEGSIKLRDDSDGSGAYIAKWEYSKPIPKSLESYKR